ncbi:aromatic amino acid exporter YddG [Sulfitobacter donghicola]|uniref:Membrane protein n=1 Tax=Sulfitobacter donghicola DSW-25 = KCTC 12864 = JCM 14565 TaxID=1300350 RepID=A0A073ITQ9_9RHOB|nr:EamA family transporter [Sulfitobacter donghicola]KEJ88792.1 membrane protein [Sulfitobacter donghicola DSW-25 = KCTC 12864 = JCM 14565]KIN68584.1 Permease, DMT superfamily [Sulfitobacter donghicola DSW-25 = KCTC 12864 = JCM 14565]
MNKTTATGIGFIAVLLWALLALFTVGSAPTPPLLLNALSFGIGGIVGLIWAVVTGSVAQMRAVPLRVYIFGALGLFAYHLLYFYALRLAPAAEAGLIAYLWPLLIVVFSGLLPSETLRAGHVIGAVLGFAGAALIITGGGAGLSAEYLPGYLLALLAAFTWASYSVLSRLVGDAPTASVAVFCLATSALSLPLHFLFEETILPTTTLGWASILGLGLGPVGFAFYVWDIGCKRGDIQLLGTSSYSAPLLSTLLLIVAGIAAPSMTLLWAAILITSGALIAARASFSSK